MKIGFFGTPELARDILSDLISTPGIEVVFAVTKPDAPFGRSSELRPSPVKSLATESGIPVFVPEKIRGNEALFESLKSFGADYFVVAAYGKILPNEILEMPSRLCVNVHASILPKYRGASPVQSSLISGDKTTGVTVMAMSEGMDEGDILSVLEMPIDRFETSKSLFWKFSRASWGFLARTLFEFEKGNVRPVPQNSLEATYCSKISKESGRIDWRSLSAETVFFRWRGYSPWPGIFTFLDGKRLVVEECDVLREADCPPDVPCGTVFALGQEIAVRCTEGALILKRLKIEWKPSRTVREFLNGHVSFLGSELE